MSVLKHNHKNGDLGYGENATRNGAATVLNGAVSDEPSLASQVEARQKRQELLGQYARPAREDQPSPLVSSQPTEVSVGTTQPVVESSTKPSLVSGRYTEDGRLVVSLNLPEQPAAEEKTEPAAVEKILAELQRLSARLDALEVRAQPQPKKKRGRPKKAAAGKRGRPPKKK